MTVDQGMRAEVYASLKATYGERIAEALMEMLPPAGVPELATKADLAVLGAEMGALRADLASLRQDVGVLRNDGVTVREEMATKADLALFGAELVAQLERGLREQGNRYIAWMFTGIALASAISGGVAGAVARLA